MSAFPAKAKVLLHGLKATEFNGKVGIIQSGTINDEGRQQVYVEDLDKNVALKLANLQYQERPVDSLSNKELKSILRYRGVASEFQGMDKRDLRTKLTRLHASPLQIAEWLAHANAGIKGSQDTASTAHSQTNGLDDQFDTMMQNPEMLRQQAQSMRSIPPAQLRKMNPQFANLTDAQIQQAAAQMEMMASNPQMMESAKNQMKSMTPAQRAQYQNMLGGSNGANAAASPVAAPSNPGDMLANMSPEQLIEQAQMMRSMDPNMLRQMNPQMAHMSDAQIAQAAQQMEMMAMNPDMMKMAREQMKNMSPEKMQEMMKMQGGGSTAGSPSPGMTMDPAKMLETMDTAQIKQTMAMFKSNPDMLAQVAGQSGMSKENLEKVMSSFDGMSDAQLEASLKTMAKIQKATSGVRNVYNSADQVVGGNLKTILLGLFIGMVGLTIWYFTRRGGGSDSGSPVDELKTMIQQDTPPVVLGSNDDEFSDEF